jgi:hypothetical protein
LYIVYNPSQVVIDYIQDLKTMPTGVYIRSDKCKEILSNARKGVIPWNKGKTGIYSDITLSIMRIKSLGRKGLSGKNCPTYKHGKIKTSEYKIWSGIKQRCLNIKCSHYKHYGGRGITICDRWINSFENFYEDMGQRPNSDYSIDRIDNNGNYCKENCRWATELQQKRNMRTNIVYNNECASQASFRLGGSRTLVSNRLNKKWSLKDAFTKAYQQNFSRSVKSNERLRAISMDL